MSDVPSASLARRRIEESIRLKRDLLDDVLLERVNAAAQSVITSLNNGGKVLFFGNGGSASDASHLAAELLGRYYLDRDALAAVCLCDNNAAITAIGNDYGYEHVFSRQLYGLGRPGDVAVALSTSGRSVNVVRALDEARRRRVITVAFTGSDPGPVSERCDYWLPIPSRDTPRVQEGYMLLGHIFCEIVEKAMSARTRHPIRTANGRAA